MSDFYNGKKVLVTGGTGFVGTHFVEKLVEEGANVRVPIHIRRPALRNMAVEYVPGNLELLDDCVRLCDGIDYVFHAAGAVSAAGLTVANPMSAIATNLILTARILESAMRMEVKRILIFSSGTTAYPLAEHPIKEDEMWIAQPPPVYFGYGWMRRYLELLGQFVSSKSSVGVAVCRPTAVYGRYDDFDPKTSHVIPALIRRAVSKENPFVVWGTGGEVRDFLHVSDLVCGCLLLLEKYAVCDPVNIGYGEAVSVKQLVDIILKIADHDKADVRFDDSKPTTIPMRMVDTKKARDILDFMPRMTLSQGLEDTLTWYLQRLKGQDVCAKGSL